MKQVEEERDKNLLLGKVFNAFGMKPLYSPSRPSRATIPDSQF